MSPALKIFLLIGDPVEQTVSPAMHNAAFEKLGLNCVYAAVNVPPRFLADTIAGVRAMRISGLNVTIPHKIAVADLLDELDESASLAGAVNTIKNQRGKLIGFNTDGDGALQALEDKIGSVKGKEVVLLGAGGAARAIAFSLAKAGARLTISNRTVPRAKALALMIEQKLGMHARPISLNRDQLKKALKNADVLINATSVGMHPAVNQTLVTSDMMHRGLVVNDIVYKPIETRLLREARRAGAKTVNGLGMLVHQGALAFEIWTGKRAPIKVMEAAARKELRRKSR
ncbi:MAG: shikimate dehydrogenase [Candidatus Hodarchaeaceae archaeon]|nr:shikimate dehydrogenase [Candidatus Hodarchaeaceae archaeon]